MYPFNICSAALGQLSLGEVVETAAQLGVRGIELKVHEQGHKSIADIEEHGRFLRQQFAFHQLRVPVLNSYIAAADFASIDRLIECAYQLEAQKIRLVLPKTPGNSAYSQAAPPTVVPSYPFNLPPMQLFSHLQTVFEQLEQKAAQSGIKFLFELHWGTVMSSFSGAFLLLKDFNPDYLAVTFDPANMIIEGKEDWHYGIALLAPYIQNVHVKNVAWNLEQDKVTWNWAPLQDGYLNWPELIGILTQYGYQGDYAIEDFLLQPLNKEQVFSTLQASLSDFMAYYSSFGPCSQRSMTHDRFAYQQLVG